MMIRYEHFRSKYLECAGKISVMKTIMDGSFTLCDKLDLVGIEFGNQVSSDGSATKDRLFPESPSIRMS